MRTFTLLALVALLTATFGCSMTPGKSPAQIHAEHDSLAYQARDFNDMHPELP